MNLAAFLAVRILILATVFFLAIPCRASGKGNSSHEAELTLSKAIKKDDVALAKRLMDERVGGDAKGKFDDHLLFWARSPAMAEMFIAHGLDASIHESDGRTVLMVACGQTENPAGIARVLLQHGAAPNARDASGKTALMCARDIATLELLLAAGADIKAKDNEGHGVVSAHAFYDDLSRLEFLIRHGAPFDPRTDGVRLLNNATSWDTQGDTVAYLLNHGVDPNQSKGDSFTPLMNAIMAGHFAIVKLLIDHGARINENKDTAGPMAQALVGGHMDMARLFWEHGCREVSGLTYAISQGKPVGEVQRLLDHGASPNRSKGEQFSPLELAAQMDRLEVVKVLVQRGASLSAESAREQSFISSVAARGQDDIVKFLLSQGIKPDLDALSEAAKNSNGFPVQLSKSHFERTVKLLLDAGAVKMIPADKASIPLLSAIDTIPPGGNATVLKMLLDAGLSPEAPMTLYSPGEKNERVSFFSYYRDQYQRAKDQSGRDEEWASDRQWVTDFKPFMDLLEAADAKEKSQSKRETLTR